MSRLTAVLDAAAAAKTTAEANDIFFAGLKTYLNANGIENRVLDGVWTELMTNRSNIITGISARTIPTYFPVVLTKILSDVYTSVPDGSEGSGRGYNYWVNDLNIDLLVDVDTVGSADKTYIVTVEQDDDINFTSPQNLPLDGAPFTIDTAIPGTLQTSLVTALTASTIKRYRRLKIVNGSGTVAGRFAVTLLEYGLWNQIIP